MYITKATQSINQVPINPTSTKIPTRVISWMRKKSGTDELAVTGRSWHDSWVYHIYGPKARIIFPAAAVVTVGNKSRFIFFLTDTGTRCSNISVLMMIWSNEEIFEFNHDGSWFLITNKAAANRILKEQYGGIQFKRTTCYLPIQARVNLGSLRCLYTVEMAGGCRKKNWDGWVW